MTDVEIEGVGGSGGDASVCIVVVAFNRALPLARLLRSLERAEYDGESVDLVVSIDGSATSDHILSQCRKLIWPHGRYTIRRYLRNQGLRQHVLACGDLSADYEAVILLEDDLVVSTQFYRYTKAAVDYYAGDDRVAGISLYSPTYNEMANLPFEPEPGRSSVYALQSAQSWGQVWTRGMWADFRRWYERSANHLTVSDDMPARIYSWPETSWKKFAMKFLAETGKTWIYPRVSHSTNFSEFGSHNRVFTALYQTTLDGAERDYELQPADDLVAYDIFFERVANQLAQHLGTGSEPLMVDLYGTKPTVTGPCRLLTRKRLGRKPIGTYGLALRPHEASVINRCRGNVVGEYWIERGECLALSELPSSNVVPFHINVEWKDALKFGLEGFRRAMLRRLPR